MESNDLTLVENLITCPLCSKISDDPRLLPCLHSFCFRCITQIVATNRKHFSCPSCDGTKITQNDIDSLPSNRIIHDLIQLYDSIKHPPICSECQSSSAEWKCNQCDNCPVYYCSTCYADIHSKRVFQSHSKLSIDNKSSENLSCEKHPDEKLKHWCEECQTPVCSDCCLTKQHEHHTHKPMNYSFKQLETKIKIDLEIIQSSLNNKRKEVDTLLKQIDVTSETNQTEVRKAMGFLREIIDQHEQQMLQEIERFRINQLNEIEEYQTKLKEQLRHFHLQKGALNFFLSKNDQLRLLTIKRIFFDYIDQTKIILEELQITNQFDHYYIDGLEQLNHLKEQILQYAKVTQTSKEILLLSTNEERQIEQIIDKYRTSEELDFSEQSIDDQNIDFFIEILKNTTVRIESKKMITLNLSNNQIGPQGARNLANLLRNNQILTKLDLSNNEINDDGTKYLAQILKTNKTLTILFLYGNGISEEGIQDFTDVLKTNTTLTVLDLQSNRLAYLGAQYLAAALLKNKTLTTLYLSNNQIRNQGAKCLADALQQNMTLTVLTLSDNQIDHEARRCVMEILKTNTRLSVCW